MAAPASSRSTPRMPGSVPATRTLEETSDAGMDAGTPAAIAGIRRGNDADVLDRQRHFARCRIDPAAPVD